MNTALYQAQPEVLFGVEGRLVQEFWQPNTRKLQSTSQCDFRVLVANERFLIHTLKVEGLKPHEIADITIGSDGVDAFRIFQFPEPVIAISSSIHPHLGVAEQAVLWLAYCSSVPIDRDPTNVPMPCGYLLNEYAPTEVRFALDRDTAHPGLPTQLQVFSPRYPNQETMRWRTEVGLPMKECLMLKFTTSSHSSINGCSIPTEFELINFIPMTLSPGKPDELFKRLQLRARATNVFTIRLDDLTPELTRSYLVYDARFENLTGPDFTYTSSDTALRSKDHPDVLRALQKRVSELKKTGEKPL